MRIWLGLLWLLASVAGAGAAPVPPPPPDFGSRQYIDGSGCVFMRDGQGWSPRLDRQGAPICGFPPTLSQRGIAPATPPRASVEERLFEQFSYGLRDGEFTADPRPAQELHDAPLPQGPNPLARDLTAVISRHEILQAAMSGPRDNSELCGLLGYRPDLSERPGLGVDVTYGLCPGMKVDLPRPILTEGARQDDVVTAQAAPVAQVPQPDAQPLSAPPQTPRRPETHKRPTPQPTATQRHAPPEAAGVEMIPAHARYVRIGFYADRTSAETAARQLIALGYPAALARRSDSDRQGQAVLAGPFRDREGLVRALNDLRKRGFADAVAR